jgi:hypothetical protein
MLFALPLAAQEAAQKTVERPSLAVGDQWTMRKVDLWTRREVGRTRWEVAQVGDTEATLVQSVVATGTTAAEPPQRKAVDARTWTFADSNRNGNSVELAFPLMVGKKWTSEFKTAHASSTSHLIPHSRSAHVEGWESVTVPAGTFMAMRISYVDRIMLSITDATFPAYIHETVWYVPSVKWYVKREEVVRNPLKKIETQTLEELVDMKLSAP